MDKNNPQNKSTLKGLFNQILEILDKEIESLPQTLKEVTPEKRLDFISKTLPQIIRFRESGAGGSFLTPWGE